jgi:hypothetical protein
LAHYSPPVLKKKLSLSRTAAQQNPTQLAGSSIKKLKPTQDLNLNKMKKLLLSMILVISLGSLFTSCTEEEVKPIQDGGSTESNPASWK